ncbi:hypothetical protein [Brunnivagina elsteri]|uniref:hypothetical protein n=1 Tax=Brunnivagina elsteri TaxID=1247191 RepID=UPI001177CE4E|nr:hypothetical protein [Calothrix elsteri]
MVYLFLLFFILIALSLSHKSYVLDSSRIYEKAEKKSAEQPQDNRGSGRRKLQTSYSLIMHTGISI